MSKRKLRNRAKSRQGCFKKGSRAGTKEVKMKLKELNGEFCYKCHEHYDYLQLHHIKPIRDGGPTTVKNGVLMCDRCHKTYHRLYDHELDSFIRANPNGDVVELFRQQCSDDW